MPDICIYFQVHQPYRLGRYRLFDIGTSSDYFDAAENARIVRRVADKCYLPATRLLTELVRESDGAFRVALSLSGTVLEQLMATAPEAVEAFRALVDTGGAELLAETFYHSLASLADVEEFEAQVKRHVSMVERLFDQRPTVFRNTELIHADEIAPALVRLGFRAVLVEGADQVLGWRSPNFVYESETAPGLRLLPRHYRLSDDVGFRFSNRDWHGWPLTAERYAAWLSESGGESVHLFLDYETFGEHQWEETGIFPFLRNLPRQCLERGMGFVTPSSLACRPPVDRLSFARPVSWADAERDVTAWLGNGMQQAAHARLFRLGPRVAAARDPLLSEQWRRLTTSDHLYYMCTKWFADGDVHKYFSPFPSPYDAFIAFMNVLQDLEQRLPPLGAGDTDPGSGPAAGLLRSTREPNGNGAHSPTRTIRTRKQ
jgi:alpha-amylase